MLRDCGDPAATPILIIPSLINRFHILDLAPNHSFLRYLAAHGFRPLLVDWQAPGAAERNFFLTDYVVRLAAIVDFVTAFYSPPPAGGGARLGAKPPVAIHLLGYCMGGLLALALGLQRPRQTRSLTLLATPWQFPTAAPGLGAFADLAAQLEPFLQTGEALPPASLDALFAAMQPLQEMQKFIRLAALDPATDAARRFTLTEDWLNDGVPLAANVARECLAGWYGANTPGNLQWRIAGEPVDPRAVAAPSCVIVPGRDRLVTPDSARPLARLIPGATLHEPHLGHIGLMASARAPADVWEPLAGWLAAR